MASNSWLGVQAELTAEASALQERLIDGIGQGEHAEHAS